MHRAVARHAVVRCLNFEKRAARRTLPNFFFGGFAHRLDFEAQAQGDACQRVVAIQHHMLGVDFSDSVERVFGRVRAATQRQCSTLDRHALFEFLGKKFARFQEYQLIVIVAKTLLGLPVQVDIGIAAFGVGFAFAVGLLSGYFPAQRAAKLSPVEAFRYDK